MVNGVLNYETATSYDVTVRVTNSGNQTYDETFTIDLTNLAPTALSDSNGANNTVAEGAATGTVVGVTALASDPVAGRSPIRLSTTPAAASRSMPRPAW